MATETVSNCTADNCTAAMTCQHCGEPSGENDFCCSGCAAAFEAAKTINASNIYAPLARRQTDGSYQLELIVEGMHCAACVRLIENALASNDDILSARVNMTTERLTFSWAGTPARGDALAEQIIKLGYKLHDPGDNAAEDYAQNSEKQLLKAIAVAGFAAANLMLLSIGLWSSSEETMGFATREFFHWISALIALPTVAYAGRPFFYSAYSALKERHTNMDVPISLAVILASLMSISEAARQGEYVYFDSAVMLLFFLLIGRYLDARAKGKARESASRLLSKLAGSATVIDGGNVSRVAIKDLKAGMRLLVAAGENIPADGTIIKGETDIDHSLISGETIPTHAGVGAATLAGTLNLTAPIEVSVTKASEQSLLSEIVRMMETAEQGAAKYVRLADRAATLYTPVVHFLSAATFIGWLMWGIPWQASLLNAVTVLIITCPCALGLAVPVVQVLASGTLLKNGVLLKSGDALERLAGVDTIVFDKTGTLTVGKPQLEGGDYQPEDLKLAASLAVNSRHPLSVALFESYQGDLIELEVKEIAGKGLTASYDGKKIKLGSRRWSGNDEPSKDATTALELWLSVDGKSKAHFLFADAVRTDAAHVISAVRAKNIDVHLLSGDRAAVANQIAAELGIDHVTAETSPLEKCDYINALKQQGKSVLMVGDGLNDAPALAAATVSMSPSSAVDITQNTADIVFQGALLMPVFETMQVAKQSNSLVQQNFALAIAYNIFAIPLAVFGFVTPMIAAAAMSGSSLVVIINAFRLRLRRR